MALPSRLVGLNQQNLWTTGAYRWAVSLLIILAFTGAYSMIGGFTSFTQYAVIGHSLAGLAFLVPFGLMLVRHLKDKWHSEEWFVKWLSIFALVLFAPAVGGGLWLLIFGAGRHQAAAYWIHVFGAWAGAALIAAHLVHGTVKSHTEPKERAGRWMPSILLNAAIPLAVLVALAAVYVPPDLTKPIPRNYVWNPKDPHPENPSPFFPSLAKLEGRYFIKEKALAQANFCATCHLDIFRQWRSSIHAKAAMNLFYKKAVELRKQGVDRKMPGKGLLGARFCIGCHEPVTGFSGNMDPNTGGGLDFEENKEGISCVACHAQVAVDPTHGNGSYTLGLPVGTTGYLFNDPVNGNDAGKALSSYLINAKPQFHRAAFLKDFHRDSEFCATCHKQFIGKGINGFGFIRLQNQYDQWKASPYSHPGTDNFKTCQTCHMPLVDAADPASVDGKVHSHRFAAANTAVPYMVGDTEQFKAVEAFLKDKKVKIFLDAPVAARAGAPFRFKVATVNIGVGHFFPEGTVDLTDFWLHVKVTDARGRPVFENGALDRNMNVGRYDDRAAVNESLHTTPDSIHKFHEVQVNKQDQVVYRHDEWNITGRAGGRRIPPAQLDQATYAFTVPNGAVGPLRIDATLRYRKFMQRFVDWAVGDENLEVLKKYADNGFLIEFKHWAERVRKGERITLPIIDIDSASVTVPITGSAAGAR